MSQFFYGILNVSITASVVALAVMLLRLFMKGAPRWISCLLWALVALRLVCPAGIESELSIIPDFSLMQKEASVSYSQDYEAQKKPLTQSSQVSAKPTADTYEEENSIEKYVSYASYIWISGVGVMLAFMVASYTLMHFRMRDSVPLKENIRQSEKVASPFVMGVLKPRIYIPFRLNKKTEKYVIAHEKAHLKRLDHIWKPLGFLLLCVHWFNPLMWVAYMLLCKDIEVACDEKVIREFSLNKRKDYARALLDCKMPRRVNLAYPVAFGEVGVDERIKKTLKFKKASTVIVIFAFVLITVASVTLLTDPVSGAQVHSLVADTRVTEGYEKPTEIPTEPPTEPMTEVPTEAPTEVPTEAQDYEEYNNYYEDDYYREEDYKEEFVELPEPEVLPPVSMWPEGYNGDSGVSVLTYRERLYNYAGVSDVIEIFPSPDYGNNTSVFD